MNTTRPAFQEWRIVTATFEQRKICITRDEWPAVRAQLVADRAADLIVGWTTTESPDNCVAVIITRRRKANQ